jgi:hypothetical protein
LRARGGIDGRLRSHRDGHEEALHDVYARGGDDMRRSIVITLLALGTMAGYGSGVAHLVHRHHAHCAASHADGSPREEGPTAN